MLCLAALDLRILNRSKLQILATAGVFALDPFTHSGHRGLLVHCVGMLIMPVLGFSGLSALSSVCERKLQLV